MNKNINVEEGIEGALDVYRENLNNPDNPELERCYDCDGSYQLTDCIRCTRSGNLNTSKDCDGCFNGEQLEECYSLDDSRQCYKCKCSVNLVRCRFCDESGNLRDCIMCHEMDDAQYYINNVSFTPWEYSRIVEACENGKIKWKDLQYICEKDSYPLEDEETEREAESDTPGILLYDAEEEEEYCDKMRAKYEKYIGAQRDMYYALYGEDGILSR